MPGGESVSRFQFQYIFLFSDQFSAKQIAHWMVSDSMTPFDCVKNRWRGILGTPFMSVSCISLCFAFNVVDFTSSQICDFEVRLASKLSNYDTLGSFLYKDITGRLKPYISLAGSFWFYIAFRVGGIVIFQPELTQVPRLHSDFVC